MTRHDCQCPLATHEHGTRTMYTVCGCRCWPCKVAYSEYRRAWYHGVTTPRRNPFIGRSGTRRRIEALHRVGWSGADLANRLGITFQAVYLLRVMDKPISPGVAERVAALYDELWNQEPTGRHVTKTINWSRRQGFAPPLAWDDDEIDNPDARPHTPGNGAWEHKPCGTLAAGRRHYRRGEPLCEPCRAAQKRRESEAA